MKVVERLAVADNRAFCFLFLWFLVRSDTIHLKKPRAHGSSDVVRAHDVESNISFIFRTRRGSEMKLK